MYVMQSDIADKRYFCPMCSVTLDLVEVHYFCSSCSVFIGHRDSISIFLESKMLKVAFKKRKVEFKPKKSLSSYLQKFTPSFLYQRVLPTGLSLIGTVFLFLYFF